MIGAKLVVMLSFNVITIMLNCFPIFMRVSESFILSDPDLKDPIPLEYLSHADRYSAEVKKSCLLMAKLRQASARYNIYLSSRKKNLYLLYYTVTICNSYCHG